MHTCPSAPAARRLWSRYLATRSPECRAALLEHYAPAVQWAAAFSQATGLPPGSLIEGTTAPRDRRPPGFLPYVPPGG